MLIIMMIERGTLKPPRLSDVVSMTGMILCERLSAVLIYAAYIIAYVARLGYCAVQ